MKKSSVSRTQKVYVFSDAVFCLGKMNQNPTSNSAGEENLSWFKSSSQCRNLDTIDGEPMDSSGISSQDSPHCSSATKSKSCLKWAIHQNLKDELSSCRCSVTSYGEFNIKTMKKECIANATLVSVFAKRCPAVHWSFLRSETKWYSSNLDRPQGEWDGVAELMMI